MPSPQEREEALFRAAVVLSPADARRGFLDRECAGDAALRQRLEALLAACEQSGVRARPIGDTQPTVTMELSDLPDHAAGQTIGRYRLSEKIGEGGCGVVYVAEQTEPVRRNVALKVIKLGMDTKQVVARFEAERQALAMMDHPSIAKVLDAGATDTGRPYFVMELVRGIRITDYCDQNNLSIRARLDLFIKVCQAVQHAHQKGIIHRDIKPSNILVTMHDGVPVPKVIDFGIAKATEGRLTDNTAFTQLHQFIGTPAYMSPEQAEMSGLDIDTRSDIYSLGVLLYELLVGSTPFDAKELLQSGLEGMRRIIRERKPKRPSLRQTQFRCASLPQHTKQKLKIESDLDWIAMKCLEKDRARRYHTANGLAMDILRHLNMEPILARPPSRLYEFHRSMCRHKVGFGAAAAVIVALAAGLLVSSLQANRLRIAEGEQSRLRADAELALNATRRDAAEIFRSLKDPTGVVAVLNRALQHWPNQPHIWIAKGFLLEKEGQLAPAVDSFTRAIELLEVKHDAKEATLVEALSTRARLLKELGRITEAGHDNCRVKGIPLREGNAAPNLIDLSLFYDAPLTESLHLDKGRPGNELVGVAEGLQRFAGVEFDVRGVVPLNGKRLEELLRRNHQPFTFARVATNIPVRMRFTRLHCLMGTGWEEKEGAQIGTFVLRYADGASEDLPIRYGDHVRDCIAKPGFHGDSPLAHGEVAWTGMNENARSHGGHVRLYVATWENPRPAVEVIFLDFNSTMSDCAPFLVALTVEPHSLTMKLKNSQPGQEARP